MANAKIHADIDLNTANFSPRVQQVINQTNKMRDSFVAAGAASRQGLGQTTSTSSRTGLAMLELGRAVEDAQYGIRGVMNNIPQMLLMLGMRGGLVGALTIAGVAITQLGPKIAEWVSQKKKASEATEFLKQKSEELAKALDEKEKNAINGSIQGNRRLAQVQEQSAVSLEVERVNMERNLKVFEAVADARRDAAKARLQENTPEEIGAEGTIDIETTKEIDAAKIAGIEKEIEAQRRRAAAARDYLRVAQEEYNTALAAQQTPGLSSDQKRINSIQTQERYADLIKAQENLSEEQYKAYLEEVRLTTEKEVIIKTSNDRIATMAFNLQDKLTEFSRKGAEEQIKQEEKKRDKAIDAIQDFQKAFKKISDTVKEEARTQAEIIDDIAATVAIRDAKEKGDEREVRRLERKVEIMNQIRRLEAAGFSADEAAALAEQAVGPDESGRRSSRSGRRRIGRPGRGVIQAGGIDEMRDMQEGRQPARRVRERDNSGQNEALGVMRDMKAAIEKLVSVMEPAAKKDRATAISSTPGRKNIYLP